MSLKDFSASIRRKSEMFAEVIAACRSLLNYPEAQVAKEYTYSRLSLSSIKNYDIGWFPPDENLHLLTSLVGEKVLKELGLIFNVRQCNRSHFDVVKKSVFNNHNLIFPFLDEYGNIITLTGRTLLTNLEQKEKGISKYKNAKFKREMYLYGLYESKNSIYDNNYVIVVEGQIDCISCQASGHLNTVSLTGSELTLLQMYLLLKRTNNIVFILDNDLAGKTAEKKIKKKFSEFANLKFISVPELGMDIDNYIKSGNSLSNLLVKNNLTY